MNAVISVSVWLSLVLAISAQEPDEPSKPIPVTFRKGQIPFLGVKDIGTWRYDAKGALEREDGRILLLPFVPGTYQIEFWVNGPKKPKMQQSWSVTIDGSNGNSLRRQTDEPIRAAAEPVKEPVREPVKPAPEPPPESKELKEVRALLTELAAAIKATQNQVKELQPPLLTPDGELRVLVVCRTDDLTREQLLAFKSPTVRDWLNTKCAKDDGRPGWLALERNTDMSNETAAWRKIWAVVRPKLSARPEIVFVSGRDVDVRPLPASEAALMALLREKD